MFQPSKVQQAIWSDLMGKISDKMAMVTDGIA